MMHVIDKASLDIVQSLKPVEGKTLAHFESDRYGKDALLSLWEQDGADLLYDTATP